MGRQWTKEQKAAIELRGENLLVAAGAGSGKTAVLVERIIQRVLDPVSPVDINRLLVVTFTNAAAAEMRQRIGVALFQKLKEAKNPVLVEYLQKQLSLLNIASITTLHSFCLDLLKEHYLLLDLDGKFSIANELEKELLIEDVLDRLLEEKYGEREAVFLDLINRYGGREDEQVKKLILELYQFSLSQPMPMVWLETLKEQYMVGDEEELKSSSWYMFLEQQCKIEMAEAISFWRKAIEISLQEEGPQSFIPQLQEELGQAEHIYNALDRSSFDGYQMFASVSFAALRSKGKCDSFLKERAKAYRDQGKEILLHWKEEIFLSPLWQCLEQIQGLYPVVACLIDLTKTFYDRLQQQKKKKALVDFPDLEHFALQLLWETENGVARSLQEKFVEVLVDEYQDINYAQESILRMVAREHNRFFVGDVKQSIYRFRLAEPGLFLKKYEAYGKEENGIKIDLAMNFRSEPEILDGINFLFAQLMHSGVTEIDYDEKAYLRSPKENLASVPIQLDLLNVKQMKEQEDDDISGAQREARHIGKQIQQLISDGYDYRDIVILLRSTKNWAGIFQEEFQLLGIPCYAEINTGYFESPEIVLVLSLLQVIDNPYQDIPLAAVLLSVCGGFTPEDLALLRVGEKGRLYDGLLHSKERELPSLLKIKIAVFLEKLEHWRYFALQHSVGDLVEKIYQEERLLYWVGILPGGTQRQANLKAFYRKAQEYDEQSYRGLYRFIHFLERVQKNGNDLSLARTLSEQESVVRIMSIHHSKGLEFPVVFVAGLGRRFNMADMRGDVLLHRELGLGIVEIDSKHHVKYTSLPKMAIMHKIKQETLGEELRILYVALTRAKKRLFLIGSVNHWEKAVAGWAEGCDVPGFLLDFGQIRSAKSPLDWIGRCIVRHRNGNILLRQTEYHQDHIAPAVYRHNSVWSVNIIDEGGENGTLSSENCLFLEAFAQGQPMREAPHEEEIKQILSWQYPWQHLLGKEAKLTVTEWQQKQKEQEKKNNLMGISQDVAAKKESIEKTEKTEFSQLSFAKKELIDWRYRGTMHHFIFEHLELFPHLSAAEIEQQINTMLANGMLPQSLQGEINYDGFYQFFAHEIGQQILSSPMIYRELPFLCEIPARLLYPEVTEEEYLILQGTIDMAVRINGDWVIIDYKSGGQDRYATAAEIGEKYGRQVQAYAVAFEQITHETVSKKYIYLLQQGRFVEIL